MTTDSDLLISSYLSWLKNDVSAASLSETISELTTPFLDRHNDHLQVYAERRSADTFLLTDDGYILSELRWAGVETRGSKREELIDGLLVGHGVRLKDRELQTDATTEDLGRRLHNLVQAMLSLDDMFVLSQTPAHPVFLNQVARFFDDREVRYTPDAKFSGKSGFDHLFNFVIPKSRRAPARFVSVMNLARRDRVSNILFAVNDTKSARRDDGKYYAILNDTKNSVAPDVLNAFEAYDVKAMPWSQRHEIIDELAS